tara:strand:+ start:3973 stop:4323 length:351 start_codon:yes stop_codon:yes gene_type:complete
MKEIRFRGQRVDNNEWAYGDLFTDWEGRMYNHETIGQYTGLKDKSGKEIFEGDIYFDEGESYWGSTYYIGPYKNYRVVEYNIDQAQFVARHHCGSERIDTTKEIVGNIHENPELLK